MYIALLIMAVYVYRSLRYVLYLVLPHYVTALCVFVCSNGSLLSSSSPAVNTTSLTPPTLPSASSSNHTVSISSTLSSSSSQSKPLPSTITLTIPSCTLGLQVVPSDGNGATLLPALQVGFYIFPFSSVSNATNFL